MFQLDIKELPKAFAEEERTIERQAKRYAAARGWYVRKFTSPGRRGVFDNIFARNGEAYFVEFKRPKKGLSPTQEIERKKMRAARVPFAVFDDLDDFRAYF